jgi:hypothetical protein
MKFANIILSEIIQRQEDKYHDSSFLRFLQVVKFIETESRMTTVKGRQRKET